MFRLLSLDMLLAAGLISLAMASPAASQAPSTPLTREAIEEIVRDYILDHPEILPEAIKRLRDREASARIAAVRSELERPYAGAWAGASDGDVVLVEFFDYGCPHCQTSAPDIKRLIKEDKKLKVVFRELPILGPDSEAATRESLAAAEQGRYLAYHEALLNGGPPTEESRKKAASIAGLKTVIPSAKAQAEIDNNLRLAQELGFTGTPGFIVGNKLFMGTVGYEALKEAVAEARSSRP